MQPLGDATRLAATTASTRCDYFTVSAASIIWIPSARTTTTQKQHSVRKKERYSIPIWSTFYPAREICIPVRHLSFSYQRTKESVGSTPLLIGNSVALTVCCVVSVLGKFSSQHYYTISFNHRFHSQHLRYTGRPILVIIT